MDGGLSRTVYLAVLFLSLWATPGFLYIDPGTGSALVLILTTVVTSAYFGTRGRYYSLLELLFRTRHRHQKCIVAVHSEDPRYEITFLPVLKELARRGTEVTYFTMYDRGASWGALPRGVAHQVIPAGMAGYAYLNHLEARILVTTTPQLDVMTFRRSKRVQHYCHIPTPWGNPSMSGPTPTTSSIPCSAAGRSWKPTSGGWKASETSLESNSSGRASPTMTS